jgi:hypothetical protein
VPDLGVFRDGAGDPAQIEAVGYQMETLCCRRYSADALIDDSNRNRQTNTKAHSYHRRFDRWTLWLRS